MNDLLAGYQEMNKRLVMEKIKQTLNGKKVERMVKIENELKNFENVHKEKLKDFYIYKLRHNEKDYHYWIIMLYFFRQVDFSFELEILKLLQNNQDKLRLLGYDLKYSADLFFTGKKALKVKQLLENDWKFKTAFNSVEDYHHIISMKKDIMKKILMNSESSMDISSYLYFIFPKADFSRIVLKKDMKEKIHSIIKRSRKFGNMADSIRFRKEVRGTAPVILFRGFPGTGKTLTALAVAKEMNLPIVRFKNIGHYCNVEGTFKDLVESLNKKRCVILLDDFDMILRHEHVPGAQLFEGFEISRNLILLTSNQMDLENEYLPLLRRITYKFTFRIPDKELRKKLWQFHLPEGYRFGDDVDIAVLSCFYILTGGNIKNIIMNYILLYNKNKIIYHKKLLSLINDEINKNDYSVNYHIRIENGCGIDPGQIQIKNINKLVKFISVSDRLVKLKKNRIYIGIYSEYTHMEFCRILSFYLKIPVIAELPIDLRSPRFKKFEAREEMKDFLYELLDPDDHFSLFLFPDFLKDNLDDEGYVISMLDVKVNKLAKDKAFFYFNSQDLFNKAKGLFDYTFAFQTRTRSMDKAGAWEIQGLDKIKFEEGFDILGFIKNNFSVENEKYMAGFQNHLLAYYVMKNETPLSEHDVLDVYKNIIPKKPLPLLFGTQD